MQGRNVNNAYNTKKQETVTYCIYELDQVKLDILHGEKLCAVYYSDGKEHVVT